ncbi:SapC family protein [Pelagerythrobacter marensis]|uniref:SapC family protein n=1 Tax=Pelagerythrobacter marensis TaxID=543877 RepID=A0ABZ2D8H5_9SPHN
MASQSSSLAQERSPAQSEPGAGLPVHYGDPRPLSSQTHAKWRLKQGGPDFAAQAPFVPIVAGELAAAARHYPIVFAAGDGQPIAMLGLERRNLFVEEGRWAADAYMPAYIRRYPFGFIGPVDSDRFVLAIDAGSDRVVQDGEEGTPLFEDGEPSDLTRRALAFCEAFQGEAAATRAFAEALAAQDLLIDRRADATLPDGRKFGLEGFKIVDREKFADLPDEIVLDWHRRGYLAWVNFHLASLDRFEVLLQRQSALIAVTPKSQENVSPPARRESSAVEKKAAS